MARLIDANELKKQITGMAIVNKSMNKLILLLACVLLTGCASTGERHTEDFAERDSTEINEVVMVIGDGSFDVVYSGGLIERGTVLYTVYIDAETGYNFIKLKAASINSLLIPLINSDGTYKEYSDSSTNVMTLVGLSKDGAVIIIRDDDTGVEYVIDASMNSYFIRGTSNEVPIESELILHT